MFLYARHRGRKYDLLTGKYPRTLTIKYFMKLATIKMMCYFFIPPKKYYATITVVFFDIYFLF